MSIPGGVQVWDLQCLLGMCTLADVKGLVGRIVPNKDFGRHDVCR